MFDEPLGLGAALNAAHMHGVEVGLVEHVEAGAEGVSRDDIDRHAVECVLQRHGAAGRGDVDTQFLNRRVQHRRQRGDGALGEEWIQDLAPCAVLERVGDAYGGSREAKSGVEVRVFVEFGVLLVYSARGGRC